MKKQGVRSNVIFRRWEDSAYEGEGGYVQCPKSEAVQVFTRVPAEKQEKVGEYMQKRLMDEMGVASDPVYFPSKMYPGLVNVTLSTMDSWALPE